jgi:hypothetical protein
MALFGRKKRRQLSPEEQQALSELGKDYDPLDAVPHISPGVEARADKAGHFQVRMELPPKPGLSEFLARNLGMRRAFRLQLDEQGTFFWNQIDGETNLKEISRRLRKQYKLKHEEAVSATVLFTKMLMARYVVQLEIPGLTPPPDNDDDTDSSDASD